MICRSSVKLLFIFFAVQIEQDAVECTARLGREFVCPSASGVFPSSPGACSQYYYLCSNWVSYAENCPDGYLFDPATSRCVLEAEASCESTDVSTTQPSTTTQSSTTTTLSTTTQPSTTTTEAITTTSGVFICPGTGFYPYEGYCSDKYWACTDDGQAYVMTCPRNLVFSPDTSTCVDPASVPQCQTSAPLIHFL